MSEPKVDWDWDITLAVLDPGPNPPRHYETLHRHRQEWPALWEIIDRMIMDRVGPR